MQTGDFSIIPAMAAGFISLQGQVSKNIDNTLSIPEGMINVGGNGYGYIIQANAAFDPYDALNRDASFTAVTLGDDIYVYACQQSAQPYASLICSKNATYPIGYTDLNSRKIGGFHVGRTRPIAQRFSATYVPIVEIVYNSVWDEGHRPESQTEGMAEVAPGLWASIYQLSVISGTWPEVKFGSRFGATPVRSTGGYSEIDLHRGMHASGMFEPTYEEWKLASYGAPQGANANNDTAWTATTNTGPVATGTVAKSVSCANCVDTVGNLWERLCHHFDLSGTFAWSTVEVNTGQDAAYARGSIFRAAWRGAHAGAYWAYGLRSGSSTLDTVAHPWGTGGNVCVRGFSRSRKA